MNKPYDLDDGFNKRSIVGGHTQHSYYDSVHVNMPEKMTYVTYHKTYHAKPPNNTSMSCFFFQKDIVLRGFMFNYEEQSHQIEVADTVEMAQKDA